MEKYNREVPVENLKLLCQFLEYQDEIKNTRMVNEFSLT